MKNLSPTEAAALEAVETREWLDSLDYVLHQGDKGRTVRLLEALNARARARRACEAPFTAATPYINTIPAAEQVPMPGDGAIERRIKSLVRWNALAMVVRANRESDGIGGHISTFASAATLYEVGFNHFFRGKDVQGEGDVIYYQGHASPGMYARAFVEGPPLRGAAAQFPPRAESRRRPVVLSASLADAGLLGIPDGVDGARSAHVDLSGAVHAVSREPRAEAGRPSRRSGRFSATARRTSPNRSARSRWRRARSSTT